MKKLLKIILIIISSLVFIVIALAGWFYYQHVGKHSVDQEKYPHYIGYLDPQKTISKEGFETCNETKVYKTHHGAIPEAFKENKWAFRKNILETYGNNHYTNSGYLFFRFIVNCKGETGRFEITGTDFDFNTIQFNQELIDQLHQLTADSENWKVLQGKDTPIDYYVYVGYKIKNGEITEILP
ncbi:hypothetical protein [Aquimarina spongiae]|uniref:Uncharacterized protein n=1 Tax=Aquimarina spongiae TaxID=570521 RepID=A0A1M6EJ33_9FLAO|nr:hypothetical protein [Aquimarina spongiae]SHI85406.1 hypothetical protein SAMN04488508_103428 [Aquimarina spongiae]